MSEKGRFDSAISHLANRMNSRGEGSEREELRQAISELEAAGKLTQDDIERIDNAVDTMPEYTPISNYKCPGKMVKDKFRALLEALHKEEK